MNFISTTKSYIQKSCGHESLKNLLEYVISFSKQIHIDIPILNGYNVEGHSHHQQDHIIIEHHYHFSIYNATIDFQKSLIVSLMKEQQNF